MLEGKFSDALRLGVPPPKPGRLGLSVAGHRQACFRNFSVLIPLSAFLEQDSGMARAGPLPAPRTHPLRAFALTRLGVVALNPVLQQRKGAKPQRAQPRLTPNHPSSAAAGHAQL